LKHLLVRKELLQVVGHMIIVGHQVHKGTGRLIDVLKVQNK